ncbi:MAG: DUF2336 domain-containing protein [Litorimonas sp.]
MTSISGFVNRLGKATIKQALQGSTAEYRANAVQKLGREIRVATMNAAERAFATKLMDRICVDVSALVRRALSVTLQNSRNLPRHLALALIEDIDSIAVPILSSSPVLTDQDLVNVLKSSAADKIRAIAQRKTISLHVSHAIVSYGDGAATARLAANDGALISSETAKLIADLHANDDLIREAALSRHDMPPSVVAKLINHSAEKIDANLKTFPGISDDRATQISKDTRERAQSFVIGGSWPEERLREYARALDKSGKLTPRLILRTAGRGDIRFATMGLSLLAGQTLAKTRLMVLASSGLGLKALALRARFTTPQIELLTACIQTYLSVEQENRAFSAAKFQLLVAERLVTLDLDFPEEINSDLLNILDGHANLRQVA